MGSSNGAAGNAANAGVVAANAADAAAYRAAGFDVWELSSAWSWLDVTEEGRALAKADPESINPGSPLNPALAAWCGTRPVVVDIRADAAGPDALALENLAKAIRVKTPASIVRVKQWSN